jgi:hypothetical protein
MFQAISHWQVFGTKLAHAFFMPVFYIPTHIIVLDLVAFIIFVYATRIYHVLPVPVAAWSKA